MRVLVLLFLCAAVSAEGLKDRIFVVHISREVSIGGRTVRRTFAAPAIPVDDKGLLLVVGEYRAAPVTPEEEETTSVYAIYPDGLRVGADLLGGNADLEYTFVRMKRHKRPFPRPIPMKGARPKVGDVVVIHSRHGGTLEYAARRTAATVEVVVESPRRLYALDGTRFDWSGSLVATANGDPIGILSWVASMSNDSADMLGVGTRTQVVVPLDAYAAAVRDPPVKRERSRSKAWLGVNLLPFSKDREAYFGLEEDWRGAFVAGLSPASPASRAGIRVFDVLKSIGDLEIKLETRSPLEWQKLLTEVQRLPLNRPLKCKVLRFIEGEDGTFSSKELDLTITLEDRPLDFDDAKSTKVKDLGFTVKPATRNWLTNARLDLQTGGVVVTDMENGLPVSLSGLSRGDLILKLDRDRVSGVVALEALLQEARKQRRKKIVFYVRRGTRTLFVAVSTNW